MIIEILIWAALVWAGIVAISIVAFAALWFHHEFTHRQPIADYEVKPRLFRDAA